MSKIDTYTDYMIDIANDDRHGYDQTHRTGGIDYDCSSLVSEALHKAGFNIKLGSTTRNLYEQLKSCGFSNCNRPWKKGDIHLAIGHHVAVSTNATQIVHASINEKGTTTGGKQGDQTGKEICVRSYYTPSYGWSYHLRYNETKGSDKVKMTLLKKGSKTQDVTVFEILMTKLGYYNSSIDTTYGSGCVTACKNFQRDNNLTVDGECGSDTWHRIFTKVD